MKAKDLKYTLPETEKDLQKLFDAASRSHGKARNDAQIALVGMAYMAYKHGNWDPIKRYLSHDSVNVDKALQVKWACKFIGLELVDAVVKNETTGKDNKIKVFANWKGREYIKENFEAAKATMFWSFKQPDPMKAWDINAVIRQAINTKRAKQKKIAGGELTAEERELIKTNISPEVMQLVLLEAGFEFNTDGTIVIKAIEGTELPKAA